MYPSDEDIKLIADAAAQETDSLLTLLGLVPGQLYQLQKSAMVALPSINSWFETDTATNSEDVDIPDDSDDGSDTESLSEAQELQDLQDHKEDRTLSRTRKQEDQLLDLTCAAMAVMADEAMKV